MTKLKAAGEPVLGVSECLSHITEYLYAETVGLEFLLDTPFITYTTLESTSILLSTDKKVPKVYSLQSATNQVEPIEDRKDHFQLNSNPSRRPPMADTATLLQKLPSQTKEDLDGELVLHPANVVSGAGEFICTHPE